MTLMKAQLSADERRDVLAKLQPYPLDRENELLGAINAVVWSYRESSRHQWYEYIPTRKEGLKRIQQITKTSHRLITLLSHPYYSQRVVPHDRVPMFDEAGQSLHAPTVLLELLSGVVSKADGAIDGAFPPDRRLTKKSRARFWLWEPLFEIWEKAGRTVAYSEGGPLERFVSAVQALCGLPPPASASLRQAVDEWRRSLRDEG